MGVCIKREVDAPNKWSIHQSFLRLRPRLQLLLRVGNLHLIDVGTCGR